MISAIIAANIACFAPDRRIVLSLTTLPGSAIDQMPLPIGMGVYLLDTFFADLGCENRTEPNSLKSNHLMADIDTALAQQVFDIS